MRPNLSSFGLGHETCRIVVSRHFVYPGSSIFSHSCPASIISPTRAFGQVHAVDILLRHSASLSVCESGAAS